MKWWVIRLWNTRRGSQATAAARTWIVNTKKREIGVIGILYLQTTKLNISESNLIWVAKSYARRSWNVSKALPSKKYFKQLRLPPRMLTLINFHQSDVKYFKSNAMRNLSQTIWLQVSHFLLGQLFTQLPLAQKKMQNNERVE